MVHYLSVRDVVSLQELSDHLELSPRGVQRLKDNLVDSGFNIEVVRGPQGGYILNTKRHYLNTELSIEEMKLIRQGLHYLVASEMMNSSPLFTKAIAKLAGNIDDYGSNAVTSYHSIRLNVDQKIYQKHIEMIDQAIQVDRKINIAYRKNHFESSNYVFEPYDMVIVNNFWYVNGFDEKGRYLSLKINRIDDLLMLDKNFLRDESMKENSVSQYGYRINPVKISCIVSDADFISEYIWGKHQVISWNDDGNFKLDVEFQNENAAKDFILRHGASIKMLQPEHLITWLKQEIKTIQSQYQ